jgi:thiamine-phosphate pyrophosphorylase
LVESAVLAKVDLVQLREKNLTARALYELAARAADLTRGTSTRLLVNDRADLARAANASGVHLTTQSLDTAVVRRSFGDDFLIGVSTHNVDEVSSARNAEADFVVFGPLFATPSKQSYGEPVGLERLRQAVSQVAPFPVLALGGIGLGEVSECFRAGAAGIAGIGLFSDRSRVPSVVNTIRELYLEHKPNG